MNCSGKTETYTNKCRHYPSTPLYFFLLLLIVLPVLPLSLSPSPTSPSLSHKRTTCTLSPAGLRQLISEWPRAPPWTHSSPQIPTHQAQTGRSQPGSDPTLKNHLVLCFETVVWVRVCVCIFQLFLCHEKDISCSSKNHMLWPQHHYACIPDTPLYSTLSL